MVSLQAASSMITFVGDLAAENPIGPGGVDNNQRHGDCHADEHEDLASLGRGGIPNRHGRSEEHTSELQSLMRSSYAVSCLKEQTNIITTHTNRYEHTKT